MATIDYVTSEVEHDFGRCVRVTWPTLTDGDDGAPFAGAPFTDRSVQVKGTFGASGNVNIEGSNDAGDSPTYAVLTDPQGNNLAFTAAKIEAVQEISGIIRPIVTAGDGTTDLDVTMLVRK